MKMNYFNETESTMEKYEVLIQNVRLKVIRDQLITSCCIETKEKLTSHYAPKESIYISKIYNEDKRLE